MNLEMDEVAVVDATDEALELAAGGAQGGAYTNPPMCGVVGWTMAGC